MVKKYKIYGQLKNGAILAKSNVPMNESGVAVRELLLKMGWNGKQSLETTLIICPFCKIRKTIKEMRNHQHKENIYARL